MLHVVELGPAFDFSVIEKFGSGWAWLTFDYLTIPFADTSLIQELFDFIKLRPAVLAINNIQGFL